MTRRTSEELLVGPLTRRLLPHKNCLAQRLSWSLLRCASSGADFCQMFFVPQFGRQVLIPLRGTTFLRLRFLFTFFPTFSKPIECLGVIDHLGAAAVFVVLANALACSVWLLLTVTD